MNIFKKIWKHFCLVNKHRWYVFKLACRAGIPWRGLVHDLSKYSPTEFCESVKYYNGARSPIALCREDKGYSLAWIHHRGRNKHHFEYWEDICRKGRIPVPIPYPYLVEAICDKIAAGMAYQGKNWTQHQPLSYWLEKEKTMPIKKDPQSEHFLEEVLKRIDAEGLDAVLTKKRLKEIYQDIK